MGTGAFTSNASGDERSTLFSLNIRLKIKLISFQVSSTLRGLKKTWRDGPPLDPETGKVGMAISKFGRGGMVDFLGSFWNGFAQARLKNYFNFPVFLFFLDSSISLLPSFQSPSH